ncbi:hypothetical protein, partial [Oceanidesulfovibrio marinus]|uniref:hypothetical protein n=1 Tax=Oceanidesulfovibrio marinus TaxID=370038 RepID=UPI001ABFEC75
MGQSLPQINTGLPADGCKLAHIQQLAWRSVRFFNVKSDTPNPPFPPPPLLYILCNYPLFFIRSPCDADLFGYTTREMRSFASPRNRTRSVAERVSSECGFLSSGGLLAQAMQAFTIYFFEPIS